MTLDANDDEIRTASRADLDSLLEIDSVAREDYETRREHLRRWLDRDRVWMAAGPDSSPIAYIALSDNFFFHGFIEMLMVAPDQCRQGLASRLLHHAVEHSTTARVFTSTNRSNQAMRRLLQAEAWIPSGTLIGLDPDDPELFFYKDTD